MYYNHSIHHILSQYLNKIQVENHTQWILPFLKLLYLMIDNEESNEMEEDKIYKMYYVSLYPLPNFILELIKRYNIELYHTQQLDVLYRIIEITENSTSSKQRDTFIIIDI